MKFFSKKEKVEISTWLEIRRLFKVEKRVKMEPSPLLEKENNAEEGTRTPTSGSMLTWPSTMRVYQFHHFGIENG